MKKLLTIGKISLLSLTLATSLYAQEIVHISKDEKAPYDGYLIDKKMEKKMRGFRENGKILEKENITLRELGELQDTQIKAIEASRDQLRKENSSLQGENRLNKVLYFVLGAVIVGGSMYLGTRK